MNYELKQYSFGETIGKTFNLYFNNFIKLFLIALLCQVPVALMNHFVGFGAMARGMVPEIGPLYFVKIALFFLTSLVVTSILAALVIKLVAKSLLENSSFGSSIRTDSVGSLILPIIGLSLLVGLYTALWSLLLVIPGIVASIGYSVAVVVLVLEKQSIRQAIKRSKELTRGRKWTIFGLIMVTSLIMSCITQPIQFLFGFLQLPPTTILYLSYFTAAITTPLQSCLLVVVYFNLRIEKEGFNIEHLAQQFSLAGSPAVQEANLDA